MNYIDLTQLRETWKNDEEKVRKYVYLFFDVMQRDLQELSNCVDEGNIQKLNDVGHRAKSAARTLGAEGYAILCEQLETVEEVEEAKLILIELGTLANAIELSIAERFA